MKKQRKILRTTSETLSSDLQWCIDNDWQVYVVPYHGNKAKIAIRKGGISAQGKNRYAAPNGMIYTSNEVLGQKVWNSQKEASIELSYVLKQLREKYS
jgi:hypothetical protein